MHTTWNTQRPRLVGAAACLALLGACTDNPMSPAILVDASSGNIAASLGDTLFVPNVRKYSDAGLHPTRGRSGGASMSAWVLLSRDGSAKVEVAAGDWNGWTRNRRMHDYPVGDARLRSVQLKVFAPDGEALYTTNTHQINARTATLPALGLVPGGKARVQSVIERTNGGRVGVVTIDAQALLRPDLTVTALQADSEVNVNTRVNISAVVREQNGDLGAWADCVLYVDGVEADRAHGIWIDAKGAASCLFSHTFTTAGQRQLEVRATDVAPGDYFLSNNGARKTISIVVPPTTTPSSFTYTASFDDLTSISTNDREDTWAMLDGRSGGTDGVADTATSRTQTSFLSASMKRALRFPLAELSARQFTSVETVHSASFTALDADFTYDDGSAAVSCVRRGHEDEALGRAWLYVCAYDYAGDSGFTTVSYERYAGEVTYVSREYSRYWERDTGVDDVYSVNHPSRDVMGSFVRYGQDYSFALNILDVGGPSTLATTIPLVPYASSYNAPRSCRTLQDAYVTSSTCTWYSTSDSGVAGYGNGEPTP